MGVVVYMDALRVCADGLRFSYNHVFSMCKERKVYKGESASNLYTLNMG